VTEIKGWSSNVLDGLRLSCSDGTVLPALGGNQTGSPVVATSSQGFTKITVFVAMEEQNIPELKIPPFNVTRVVGLTALDSSGATTSWGVSSTSGSFNNTILSCNDGSGDGKIISVFGTVLVNLYEDDPSKWPIESLGIGCGGIKKCEYSWVCSKHDLAASFVYFHMGTQLCSFSNFICCLCMALTSLQISTMDMPVTRVCVCCCAAGAEDAPVHHTSPTTLVVVSAVDVSCLQLLPPALASLMFSCLVAGCLLPSASLNQPIAA
jgi:hypothetical protein